jgi:hypothetical protein
MHFTLDHKAGAFLANFVNVIVQFARNQQFEIEFTLYDPLEQFDFHIGVEANGLMDTRPILDLLTEGVKLHLTHLWNNFATRGNFNVDVHKDTFRPASGSFELAHVGDVAVFLLMYCKDISSALQGIGGSILTQVGMHLSTWLPEIGDVFISR